MSSLAVASPATASVAPAARPRSRDAVASAAIFVAWGATVLWLASRHQMWRDEVRALSLAIEPQTISEMFAAIHGEGHPALWYLILRTGYALSGSTLVLPVASILASGLGIAFLLARAPLPPIIKLLIAGSCFALIEYPVVARNYGISLLPMFAFAALYDGRRTRGIALGAILFILANTNVHSAIAVVAFLGLWGMETIGENGLAWSRSLRVYLINAALATAGVIAAFLVVYGPANDAIATEPLTGPRGILRAVVDPGLSLQTLVPPLPSIALSLILFGCLLGLVRRPAVFLAGLGSLLGFSLLFSLVYPGYYRHASIWIVVVIALTWIVEARRLPEVVSRPADWARTAGRWSLIVLLALQVGLTKSAIVEQTTIPWSNSVAVAALIHGDPRLANAVVMAEPDFLLEPLPYYGVDRLYLTREDRFGHVVNFTRRARRDHTLGDILETARKVKRQTGSEVVILMAYELDRNAPAQLDNQGWGWVFRTDPADMAEFLDGTERLARFGTSIQGEDYTVYRVR